MDVDVLALGVRLPGVGRVRLKGQLLGVSFASGILTSEWTMGNTRRIIQIPGDGNLLPCNTAPL